MNVPSPLQGAFEAYLGLVGVAPNLAVSGLVVLAAIAAGWLLLYRPAPALGMIEEGADGDLARGTPFWAARPRKDRARRVARPVAGALLRGAVFLAAAGLLWTTVAGLADRCFDGELDTSTSWACQPTEQILLALNGILFVPVIIVAVVRRFWTMGRTARVTVVEGADTIGLAAWWLAELGVQPGARIALRHGSGPGKSKIVSLQTNGDRTRIAVPGDVRAALDLKLGTADLVFLPKRPFPVWPVAPISLALAALAGAYLIPADFDEDEAVPAETAAAPKFSDFELCIIMGGEARTGDYCKPLLEKPFDPQDKALIHLTLGRYDAQMGDDEAALGEFDAALAGDPTLWQAYQARAEIHIRNRAYPDAIAALSEAIKLAPSVDLYTRRGTVRDWSYDVPAGVADFSAALRFVAETRRGDVLRDRAESNFIAARYDAAVADAKRAVLYGASPADVSDMLGRAQYMAGLYQDAMGTLGRAAALAPDDAYPAIWLFLAEERAGVDGAARLRERIDAFDPQSWEHALISVLTGLVPAADVTPGDYPGDDTPQLAALAKETQACELNFYLGELALMRGENADAAARFKAAVSTGVTEYVEYGAARHELTKLVGGATP